MRAYVETVSIAFCFLTKQERSKIDTFMVILTTADMAPNQNTDTELELIPKTIKCKFNYLSVAKTRIAFACHNSNTTVQFGTNFLQPVSVSSNFL